jgi:hypothetical protein
MRIYRGWPNQSALNNDLANGVVNVTVFAVPNATRNTTRYIDEAWFPAPVTPALTVAVTGNTATFAGTASLGQLAGVLFDNQSFVHRTATGDTPALVAATLAAAISPSAIATVSGASLTIPASTTLIARTVADASTSTELRRQQQSFRITAWCPTPDLRDAVCETMDVTFAATPFLDLPGGFYARLRFASTTTFDNRQDAALYRRDLIYTVDYPTTQTAIEPSMLFGAVGVGATTILA